MTVTAGGGVRTRSLLDGKPFAVSERLGKGGEALVYRLTKPAGTALKEYTDQVLAKRGPELDAKLRAMVRNPPTDPTRSQKHVSIAWPTTLALDASGAVCGYVMPAIDKRRTAELHQVQTPSDRMRTTTAAQRDVPEAFSGFTWKYLLRVASNLASATGAIHEAGYVIGDFNYRNVLVSETALVTLLDCDSFQVPGPNGQVFLCRVQLPGTHPPELMRADLTTTVRETPGDLHVLAVHIYLLLMEGHYPFAGKWTGRGEALTVSQRKEKGVFHHLDKRVQPPLGTPPFELFPTDIREMFVLAFRDGATDPAARPSASDWNTALSALEGGLAECGRRPEAHVYPGHLRSCPWCPLEVDVQAAQKRIQAAGQRPLPQPVPSRPHRAVWSPPQPNTPWSPPQPNTPRSPPQPRAPGRPTFRMRYWWLPSFVPIIGPAVSWSYAASRARGRGYFKWALLYDLLLFIVVAASGSSSSSSSGKTPTGTLVFTVIVLVWWVFGPMVQALRRRRAVTAALAS